MHVGVVFSQADSGVDPVAIRRFATDTEAAGYQHLDAIVAAKAEVDRLVGI